jgi:hypothetical protein
VGTTDALILATAVVHDEGIEIQTDVAVIGHDRSPAARKHTHAPVVREVTDDYRLRFQLLPQPDAALRPIEYTQRLAEESVLARGFDGLKVTLAQGQQRLVTCYGLGHPDLAALPKA